MSRYYIDYENFATRKERMIRAYINGEGSKLESLSNSRSKAKKKFLNRYNLSHDTRLKGDLTDYNNIPKLAKNRVNKNDELRMGTRSHYPWAERKEARTREYNKRIREKAWKKERNRILKHAVIKD